MISTMAEYSERLAEAMQAAGYDKTRLHRELGISYQAVKKAVEGGKFGTDNHLKAAKLLGVSPDWLADGKGARNPSPPTNSGGHVAHGLSHWDATVILPELKWEELPMADMSQLFQLVVPDDALGPIIYQGCIARFDPAGTPRPGWPVLVRDRSGAYYLRDYIAGPAGRWKAVARTHGFAPLDSEADGLIVVAVMKGFDWT